MKCGVLQHFIWVFTVCQSSHLGISWIQSVKLNEYILLHYLGWPCNTTMQFFLVSQRSHLTNKTRAGYSVTTKQHRKYSFSRLFRGRNSCRCLCVEFVKLLPVQQYNVDSFHILFWSFMNIRLWQRVEYRLISCYGAWELLHFPLFS